MKVIIKRLLQYGFLFLTLLATNVNAQQVMYPELDKPVPAFSLKGKVNDWGYPVTSETLKGSYYILDFWTTSCGACIASFPKIDSLQVRFGKRIEFILVGQEERNRNVFDFYEVYRRKFGLKINSVFDSATFKKFVYRGVPHLVWINDKGIITAITTSTELTQENIEKFISGEKFSFYDRSYKGSLARSKKVDLKRPLLIGGNGGNDTDYVFRSLFSIWNQEQGPPRDPGMPRSDGIGTYQLMGMPISYLYAVAFFGNVNPTVTPNAVFTPVFSKDAKAILAKRFPAEQSFNYSIEMPEIVATRDRMMQKMQSDLAAFLGLKARLVNTALPSYKLVISNPQIFSTYISSAPEKRVQITWNAEDSVHVFEQVTLDQFLMVVNSKLLSSSRPILENNTGKNIKLSFKIAANIDNFDSIREGVKEIGLEFQPSTKQMNVIEVTADQ